MKKLYLTALNFFITVLFCSSVSYAAILLHMDLSKTHVLPGETFTVDLYLTDVPGDGVTFGLSAYSHDLLVHDALDVVAVRVDSAGDSPNSNLEVGKVNASDYLFTGFWSGQHVDLFEVDLKFEEGAMPGTIATLGQSWHHLFGENFAGKAVSGGPITGFDQLIQFIPSSAEVTLVPIPPTVLLLKQLQSDGTTEIPVGGITAEPTVVFEGKVTDPEGKPVRLEIELREIGEPFTGVPTDETISNYVDSGHTVSVTRYGLDPGGYHWQARTFNGEVASEWVPFGGNSESEADFVITPPAPPGGVLYLDNGVIKVGVDLEQGGAITEISHNGFNLVDPSDPGRLVQVSLWGDDPSCPPCWNPIQGGSINYFSKDWYTNPVIDFYKESNLIYIKAQLIDWWTSVLRDVYLEQWVTLLDQVSGQNVNNAVKVRYKIEHTGDVYHGLSDQEFPCAYLHSTLNRLVWYEGTSPWQSDDVENQPIPPPPPNKVNFEFYPTEYWAACVNEQNFGLTMYSAERTPRWAAKHFGSPHPVHCSFLGTIDEFSIDPGTTEEAIQYYVVGNYPDARNVVYLLAQEEYDTDNDCIPNDVEMATGTDPFDDDTDDDGLLDGPGSGEDTNANGIVDPGETDPRDPDSDGDGIQDGTEKGLMEPEGLNTDMDECVLDADPSTTTDPLNPDSDADGLLDGQEDYNKNGKVDQGETDPNTCNTRPQIKITSAYTTDYSMLEKIHFSPGSKIFYHIIYSLYGKPGKLYKAKGIVNVFGQTLVEKQKVERRAGYHIIIEDQVPNNALGEYTIKYKLKMLKNGVLLDKEKVTSQIYVVE